MQQRSQAVCYCMQDHQPYEPHKELCLHSELGHNKHFVQLLAVKHPPKPREAQPGNVRHFHRDKGHGVWSPGLEQLVSWHGGPNPPAGYPTDKPTTPFHSSGSLAQPSVPAAVATATHFTEPVSMRRWARCALIAQSALAGAAAAPLPAIRDVEDQDDKLRGNQVQVMRDSRPSAMSVEAWVAAATLRAYPNLQLPRLCAALRDHVLDDVLDHPDVRSTPLDGLPRVMTTLLHPDSSCFPL